MHPLSAATPSSGLLDPPTLAASHATPPLSSIPSSALNILQATYESDYTAIASYLLRRTGDPHLASDLASETFVEALRSLDRWQPRGLPLRCWLFRIATNRLSRHRRRTRRAHGLLTRFRAGHSDRELTLAAPADHVRGAIARLRPHHQDVLVLHHVEGLTIAQIALTLDIAEGTVKSRLDRARAAFHGHLTAAGESP